MKSVSPKYFWGIDCGSTEIKVVVTDINGKVLHKEKRRTLFPLIEHVKAALMGDEKVPPPFHSDGHKNHEHWIVSTGYGRSRIEFANDKLTEIKAHCIGVHIQMKELIDMSQPYTIVDIGGQDSKIIESFAGDVRQFVINRKCAAGTGAYIEELAHRLRIPLEKMSELEQKHDQELTLNSYCTVFAGQEVLRILMEGEKVENLIHSLYQSVVKRIFEMAPIPTASVVFSGGVLAHHDSLRKIFAIRLGSEKKTHLAPSAQFCGALGACEFGRQQWLQQKEKICLLK